MKNDTPKNAQAHLNSETDKPEKNKQKIIDKVKALDEQAKKLKAKEYRSGTQEDNNQNEDLVANKTNHLHAENIDSSSTETQISGVDNPGENTTDHEALNHDNIESVTPQTDKPHVVVTEVVVEQEQQVHQGHRVGKGGGVTTPEGVSFSLTEGLHGGVLASGILGTSSKLIHHGVQPQVEGLSYPDGISASKNIVTAPEIAKNSAGETGTVTSVTKPDKSTQLIPEQISQTTAGETLSPKLSPDQTPQVSQQVIPLSATIQVDAITPDNILNLAESKGDVVVSGTVGGDAIDGDVISLTVNGSTFTGIVSHGTFNITIGGHELSQDSKVLAQITVSNPDGRTLTATDGQNYRVDTSIYTKDDLSAATEDQDILATSGNVLSNDDLDNTEVTTADIDGRYGIYHFNPDGSYTYKLDNDKVQHLAEGQVIQDTVTYEIRDNAGNTAQAKLITEIIGTNDQAIITGTSDGKIAEDKNLASGGTLRADGQLSVTDLDTAENQFSADSLQGQYGQFSIDNNGHWTYTANNSSAQIQGLNTGESLTDTLLVHSVDGTAQKVTVTINGTDDHAVIAGTASASLTEDKNLASGGNLRADGQLSVTDLDTAENQFTADSLQGQYGQLSIDNNGHWTYTANNSSAQIQGLKTGESLTDTLLVHSVDGTAQQVTVSINGSDDKAIIAGTATASLTEDKDVHSGQLRVDGALTVTDSDNGQAQFSADTLQGQFGTLSINNLGHWSYTADNSSPQIQGLKTGETVTESLLVHSVDGTEQTITITLNGRDDQAVISGVSKATLTEDKALYQGQLRADGQLSVTDLDHGENQFQAENIQGQYGLISINNAGYWTYTADSGQAVIQALTPTTTLIEKVVVHSIDGTEHEIAVTIEGTTDAAVISGVDKGDVTEDVNAYAAVTWLPNMLHTQGKISVVDPDSGESHFDFTNFIHVASHPEWAPYNSQLGGKLSLDKLGNWEYIIDTTNPNIQALGDGESLKDSITIHSSDGTTHVIEVMIHGTNDAPIVSQEAVLSVGTEDTDMRITVAELLTNATDIDHNDINQLSVDNLHVNHGSIRTNADGSFTFSPAKDYNGAVHFTYDVKDAHGGVTHTGASTTLTATPDGAIISEVTTEQVIEDGSHSRQSAGVITELANGQLQVVDLDNGEDKFQYSQFGETAIHDPFGGMLRIDSAGNWGYSVNNAALQHLAQGQTETVIYRIHSYDGTVYELHIDVVGTNDEPTVTQVALTDGAEDTNYQMQASQFGFTDVDNTDTLHSISITDLPDITQGKFVLGGHDINANQVISVSDIAKLQFIPANNFNGDVLFKFTVNDGNSDSQKSSNTLHINPVNDAANISGDLSGSVIEDTAVNRGYLSVQGLLSSQDTDNLVNHFDSATLSSHSDGSPAQGHLLMGAGGHWIYQIENSKVQHLGAGEKLIETFTVRSDDGTPQQITTTVTGTNDAPVLSVNQSSNTNGTLKETDIDKNDSHIFATTNGVGNFGTLTVDSNTGAYSYSQNPSVAGMNYDPIRCIYSGKESFAVEVKDGHGGIDTKYIDMLVEASVSTGNPPVISTHVSSANILTKAPVQVVTTPPTNTVTIDLVTASDSGLSSTDNITNDATPSITGTTALPLSKVDIVENGKIIASTYADDKGRYSVILPSLGEGNHDITAQAIAPSAATAVDSSILPVTIDTVAPQLLITLDSITKDNIINANESGGDIDIIGNVAGEFKAGDLITLTVNGKDFTGKAPADGHFIIAVPGSDLAADSKKEISAVLTSTDTAGNHGFASNTYQYGVDTVTPKPIIRLDRVTTDDIVNAKEAGTVIDITGNITGVFHGGDPITLMVNGKTFTGTVPDNGHFSIIVPGSDLVADGNSQIIATVSTKDIAGNIGIATDRHSYNVDVRAPAVPIIQATHLTGSHSITVQSSAQGGFALDSSGSHSHHSAFGTAHIDSNSGEVSFSPVMSGNPHTRHHGEFEIFQHGQHVANVEIDSWNHNRHPAQITVNPIATVTSQSDEPEQAVQVDIDTIIGVTDIQSDPVDPYLDMLGLSKGETQSNQQSTTADELFTPVNTSLNDENADPLVDDAPVDVFASPLDDDKRDDFSALDDSQTEQGLGEPLIDNDDDSLHQALIDMHSQI